MLFRIFFVVVIIVMALPGLSFGFEMQPLSTRNLSPLTLGFGLPALGQARVLQADAGRFQTTFDLVSNYTLKVTSDEKLLFDGETSRAALEVDYGFGSGFEFGAALPLLSHQGGSFDNFIEGWHSAFGLPQSGRDLAPSDRFDYSYDRAGQGFELRSGEAGLGDLSLRAAWQCWEDPRNLRALALRASLKLPTGSASRLLGSGSTDLAIWLSGEQRLNTESGPFTLYGGGGGLLATDGDLLAEQRRNIAGLVSLGLAWQPWRKLGFQLQFDGHSALFRNSDLPELGSFAGQLAIGGSFAISETTAMELAVVEDIIVNTAPDVVFHLGLRAQF